MCGRHGEAWSPILQVGLSGQLLCLVSWQSAAGSDVKVCLRCIESPSPRLLLLGVPVHPGNKQSSQGQGHSFTQHFLLTKPCNVTSSVLFCFLLSFEEMNPLSPKPHLSICFQQAKYLGSHESQTKKKKKKVK